MDSILEDDAEFNDIVVNRKQLEIILHKTFINDKHWEMFRNNFLYHFIYHSKRNIFEYYDFILREYEDVKSRG